MERTTDASGTETQTGPEVTQIDSNLNVTAKVTAPTMLIGDENKTCCIEVTKDNKMLITLPTTGKGQPVPGKTQTYDMRSIIESIQELNRRTATFNCNVTFNSALEAFDTSTVPNDAFACDLDNDGLPAAQPGEIDIESANGLYKVPLVATERGNADIYTLNDSDASNSLTVGLDNDEILALHDALANFIPPQLSKTLYLTFFDKSGNRMNNVVLTNIRINILDSADGYMIYLVVEGYGIFIIKYNTEAHLVIESPNVYAMNIHRVQKSNISSGLVYLVAWKNSGNMSITLYDDAFKEITLDSGVPDIDKTKYDDTCTWDKYSLIQRFTGVPSKLVDNTNTNGRYCMRSQEDFILPLSDEYVYNFVMDYVASITEGKTCNLLPNNSAAPAFSFNRSSRWTKIASSNNNADIKIGRLLSNTLMIGVTSDNVNRILMQHRDGDVRHFLIASIYVNNTEISNYSYLEFKSVSAIKWFFMLNTNDKCIDLAGTDNTESIEILTSNSNVRPKVDGFLYVYNPDKHITNEDIISDTYYLINNGGIYKYTCEYSKTTNALSCTVDSVITFTPSHKFSFAFPTNGSREAIIVDINNTTYIFNPTTNEFIAGHKLDISSTVALSNNGVIITTDHKAYYAISLTNVLY